MKKIRIGIIGTGFSASFHAEALRRLTHIELVGVAGHSPAKAHDFALRHSVQTAYDSAEDMISDPSIEAIHNCTPNHLHYKYNRLTLLAGKHLMSEKPLGLNTTQSAELVQLAQSASVASGVCFNYRHFPLVIEAREAIKSQLYGNVHYVFGGYLQDWLLYQTDYNWRILSEYTGDSRAIADIGSHWCDVIQFVLGCRITEVCADLSVLHPLRTTQSGAIQEVGTEDFGSVLFRLEDGSRGSFIISQVSAGRKNNLFFEISASDGSLSWNQEEPNQLWIGRRGSANKLLHRDPDLLSNQAAACTHYPGGHQEGWPDAVKNLFTDFYGDVHLRLRGDGNEITTMYASLEDAHSVMKITEAIIQSNRLDQWVQVSS